MRTALTLPLMIRPEEEYTVLDLSTLDMFAYSLKDCEDIILIIYNQGVLTNEEIDSIFTEYNINFDIIGDGVNIGIPIARQKTFEYVWDTYPEVEYISEVHLDMIFSKNWHLPIIKWLDEHPDEPMLSPAIINTSYYMDANFKFTFSNNLDEVISFLNSLSVDKIIEGLVHPAIHRSSALKTIGGIDIRFFKAKQGYEDYSILLGYRYWMGIKNDWRPKVYGKATVYHTLGKQRWTLDDVQNEIFINGEGLFFQYGSYGLRELSIILNDEEYMGLLYRNRVDYFINSEIKP